MSNTSVRNVPSTSLFLQRNQCDAKNVGTVSSTRQGPREWCSSRPVDLCTFVYINGIKVLIWCITFLFMHKLKVLVNERLHLGKSLPNSYLTTVLIDNTHRWIGRHQLNWARLNIHSLDKKRIPNQPKVPSEYERFLVDLTLMDPLEMGQRDVDIRSAMLKELYSHLEEPITVKCSILDLVLNTGQSDAQERLGKLWSCLKWDQDVPWLMSLMIGINPYKCDLMSNLVWVNSMFEKHDSNNLVNPIDLVTRQVHTEKTGTLYPIEKEAFRMLNKVMNNESLVVNMNWEMEITNEIEKCICNNTVKEGIEILKRLHRERNVFTMKAEKYLIYESKKLHSKLLLSEKAPITEITPHTNEREAMNLENN